MRKLYEASYEGYRDRPAEEEKPVNSGRSPMLSISVWTAQVQSTEQ